MTESDFARLVRANDSYQTWRDTTCPACSMDDAPSEVPCYCYDKINSENELAKVSANLMPRLLEVVEAAQNALKSMKCQTRWGHQDNACARCILHRAIADLEDGDAQPGGGG